jgi:integrase
VSKEPILVFTNDQCVIEGAVFSGLPMLVDYDSSIIEPASDWLRYLRVYRRRSVRSVRQFAYHLKYWWSYINSRRIPWDSVNDFLMIAWREKLYQDGVNERVVNGYISTVFRFYLWSERGGYTRGLIGEPDIEKNFQPPLTVEVKYGKGGVKMYSSPILKKTTRQPILPTPTNDEITSVHWALTEMYGDRNDLAIRDTLILTWFEHTGVRRVEAISLTVKQIPEWDDIEALRESGEKLEITVNGKGDKSRSIWVGAELLMQTRDYIEIEREATVKRFRSQLGSVYRRPKEIFLSSKTGRVLSPDSVSQIFARAFKRAQIKGSGHRVRARFLTNLALCAYAAQLERGGSIPDLTSTLLPIAQIAGHSRVETLFPYIIPGKKWLLKQTDAERAAKSEERALTAERREASILIRSKAVDSLRGLALAVKSGNRNRIEDELKKFVEMYIPKGRANKS